MPPKTTKSISGVEIFAAGVWNGDEYSVQDLDEMIRGFEDTGKTFRPALKLGHAENQTLLQQDGLPAAGWVGALYRKGLKLFADFIDIPDKIYDLLKRGAYKKVSSEIFWNAKVGEADYRRLLGGVALLGADMPGVTCLNDIFDMYAKDTGELHTYELERKSFTIELDVDAIDKGDQSMTPQEIQALKDQLAAEQQKNHTLAQEKAASDKALGELKTHSATQETRIADIEKKHKDAEEAAFQANLEKEVTELSSEKLITKAMKPFVKELLSGEKKEYSLKIGKEEKKFSKVGLLKEILKLHSASDAAVNGDERSVDNKLETEVSDGDKALNEKIEKYAKDNKVSYKLAYKAVMLEQSSDVSDEDESEETEVA